MATTTSSTPADPWLPRLYMVNNRPSLTAIPENPAPSSRAHSFFGPFGGHVEASGGESTSKLRFGPPNCGHWASNRNKTALFMEVLDTASHVMFRGGVARALACSDMKRAAEVDAAS